MGVGGYADLFDTEHLLRLVVWKDDEAEDGGGGEEEGEEGEVFHCDGWWVMRGGAA